MFKRLTGSAHRHSIGKILPLSLLALFILGGVSGCENLFHSNKQIKASNGDKIDLDDETVKQYVEEWHDAKPSIDRLASLEKDLTFLLSEVSKLSDLGQVPGLANNFSGGMNGNNQVPLSAGVDLSNNLQSVPATSANYGQQANDNFNEAGFNPMNALCPEPYYNNYKKSIAFVSFPRMKPLTSNLGALHQVEQHLPMLVAANLRNRHAMLTPTQLRESLNNVNNQGELATAAQARAISRQNRSQFLVSGEVDDMSMKYPDTKENASYYTRFVNGLNNLISTNTPEDKRTRTFSFTVQVRDGFTGQVIYSNQYQTFGKWDASPGTAMGFDSAGFWQTDYGRQVQLLVGKASNDLAGAIRCQPYMARVDARPYQQQVVIQSGTNNGLRSGDTLDLYQVVYQPVSGEYQQFDTQLVKHNGRVYLTEIFPSHSIGQVVDETLSGGQYLVKAQ